MRWEDDPLIIFYSNFLFRQKSYEGVSGSNVLEETLKLNSGYNLGVIIFVFVLTW